MNPAPTQHSLLAKCSRREQLYILELLKDPQRNQTQAYERAGFQARGDSARANAAKCLAKNRVRAAYEALLAEQTRKALADAQLTATDVMRAIARHVRADGEADVRDLFDERGNLRPVHELSEAAAMLVGGFEVVQRNLTSGYDETDTIIKVKQRDHARYVEMAAKHFANRSRRRHPKLPQYANIHRLLARRQDWLIPKAERDSY